MKKLLSIIVFGLLWFNPLFSDEYDWKKIVKKNTPNINLYLGDDLQEKTKKSLFDKLIKNMKLSHQMPMIDDDIEVTYEDQSEAQFVRIRIFDRVLN